MQHLSVGFTRATGLMAGAALVALYGCRGGSAANVAPPASPKIIFSAAADIWSMNLDGSEPKRLVDDELENREPRFSPDRRKIVFTSQPPRGNNGSGQGDICLINVDGSGKINLTGTPDEDEGEARWSLDGRKIVFSLHHYEVCDKDSDTYVMNADGSARAQIEWKEAEPLTVAPGRRIVKVPSGRLGKPAIYLEDVAGKRHLLSGAAGEGASFDFSPDGRRVVFSSGVGREAEIYVMNADGSAQKRLTNGADMDIYPRFAPDGRRIVFVAYRDGEARLYIMQADGSKQTRLTPSRVRGEAFDVR